MEDADGEQNELKTLQGQVKSLLLLNSPEISDLGSKFVDLKKTLKSLQLDQTQKLVQQLSTQLADLRFYINSIY